MKVIIEGKAYFTREGMRALGIPEEGEPQEQPVEVVGHPDEELDRGMVLLVHPAVSLEVSVEDLRRALRVFEP